MSRSVTYRGLTFRSVAACARRFGLSHSAMRHRLAHGDPVLPSAATQARMIQMNMRRAAKILDAWRARRE